MILLYLSIVNIIAFAVYGIDKSKARKHQWRISENMLILLAALGGSIGALLAMNIFHHKTKHVKFFIGVPAILIMQIAIAYFSVRYILD